jgi:hypothetical protein
MSGVTFKKLSQYHRDPEYLQRQLSQFETNVGNAFESLGSVFPLRYRVRVVERQDCSALPWDMLPIDSSGGDMTVRLPPPSPKIAGASLVILRQSASSAVTIEATTGLVNAGATMSLPSDVRAYTFFCDSIGWWGDSA